MSYGEQYNGWSNRETWAFWLHVTNDQGWYESVRDVAEDSITVSTEDMSDYHLGEQVVEHVKDTLEELLTNVTFDPSEQHPLFGMRDDIGSWWRIDLAEIGAAARDLVPECTVHARPIQALRGDS